MKTNRERARLCWIEMSLGNIARPGNGDLVEEIIERALDEAAREAVEAEREAITDECNETAKGARILRDKASSDSLRQYHVGRKDAILMLVEFIRARGAQ